jgi:arylsulfatase A-like enzyme
MGTPMRSIRTKDFLYIHNSKPDRWPAGAPQSQKGGYGDIDGGPTKDYILKHKDEPGMEKYYEMACAKRPEGELFDVRKDPYQLNNLADNPEYAQVMKQLKARLMETLEATGDLRALGQGDQYETYPYLGGAASKAKKKKK